MSKRYERMSKEKIVGLIHEVSVSTGCNKCPIQKWCYAVHKADTCGELLYLWLTEEIKTKKAHRYELIKSPEDVDKALEELSNHCDNQEDCCFCQYEKRDIDICFGSYLKEEIEVEEE